MKNYKSYFIAPMLSVLFIQTSCKKILDVPFDNRLVISSTEDYSGVLKSAYPTRYDLFNEVLTDNYKLVENLMQSPWKPLYIPLYLYSDNYSHMEPYNSPNWAYEHFYNKIYMTNLVIENIMSAEGNQADKEVLLAEALLIRSYCYFTLTNIFGKHYNPNTYKQDLAVPLILGINRENRPTFSRATVKQAYDQIESDLQTALTIFEKSPSRVPNTPYRFTLAAAYAFATRISLYKSDFEKTVEFADKAIDQKGRVLRNLKLDYDILTASGWAFFAQQFNDPVTHQNIIMSVQSPYVHHPIGNSFGGFYLTPEVLSMLTTNDYRRLICTNAGTVNDNATYMIKNNTGWQASRYVYFNMEEVLINRAEANLRRTVPNRTEALLDIEDLRKLRLRTYAPLNAAVLTDAQLLTEVYRQRRVEFLTEGLRWYDIKRLGLGVEHKLDQHSATPDAILLPNDPRTALQIPVSARIGNPDLENQLNPR